MLLFITSIIAFAPVPLMAADAPAPSGPYHFIKDIHIGGVANTDYLTVDSAGQRLYVSHGTSVAVIDLAKDEMVGEVSGFTSVHGIAIAPKLGLGYVSDGRGNKVSIFDLKTLKVTKTVDTGSNPDWIVYEPSTNEVYVCNGSSRSISAFDATSGNVTATIDIGGGRPETAQVDPKSGMLYDNLEDKFSMAVVDLKTHKMVGTPWPAVAGKGGSGLAIDVEHHKLILGCEDTMAMMDTTTGKVVATLPAATGIDSAAFDPGTQLAFTPGGTSGTVTIAKEDGNKLTLVQTLTTAPGAKTMAVDPSTHKIYLATVQFQPAAAASASTTPAARPTRGTPVADSFHVLVYGMDEKK